MSDVLPHWEPLQDAARVHVPRSFLEGVGHSLQHWIDDWSGGDPDATVDSAGARFKLTFAAWQEAGVPPAADEPEAVDLYRARHSALGQLLGLTGQRVLIESIGYIGSPGLSFILSVDGVRLADGPAPSPFALDGTGGRHTLLPAAYVAFHQICAWNQRGTTTRPEQVVFLGELRAHLQRAAGILEGAAVPFSFELDPHLDKFRTTTIDAVAVRWEPQNERGAVFDLKVDQVQPDGQRVPLDLRKLDPDSPMIAVSATEHVLLPLGVAAVARVAQKQASKLRKHVEQHFQNPASLFPEGVSLANVDLSAYSPRVLGFAPILKAERAIDIRSSGVQWYETDDDNDDAEGPTGPFLQLEIVQPGGGEIATLELSSPEELEAAVATVEAALAKHPPDVVEIGNQRVEPTPALAARLKQDLATYRAKQAAAEEGAPAAGATKAVGRLAAVIAEDVVAPVPAAEGAAEHPVPWERLDALLAAETKLKQHQRAGIEWMWSQYQGRAPGVLLADDMGLGKTLQLAAFMALQRTSLATNEEAPSLIVCPVILLDNWRAELHRFFRPDVFDPLLVLHGDGLRRHKRGDALDLEALRRYRYILTNYDTLEAHQRSLLQLDWNVVVLDEAQAIKNSETYRSRAARGLKRRFAISSTGTPVENRLSDLWAQYDFLSPSDPFGTLKQFRDDYEEHLASGIPRVRAALRYPGPTSSLLRRIKSEVLDLPPKTILAHALPMSDRQVELERSIVQRGEQGGGILNVLSNLQKLYQHPRLLLPEGDRRRVTVDQALAESPKLAHTLALLQDIRQRGEKVLVFTLWVSMQELLVEVIRERLGLRRVRIINGEPKLRARAHDYIKEFSATDGFDVLVLSPLAAGTGLTITAANHVIHYGRWWNPAKEDQATDRCYRIGQERPVHVHYPLLHHPGKPEQGFDVKLHGLVENKRGMAREFLAPQAEHISAAELAALQETQS